MTDKPQHSLWTTPRDAWVSPFPKDESVPASFVPLKSPRSQEQADDVERFRTPVTPDVLRQTAD